MFTNIDKQIAKLIANGKKENIDFRVIYFSDQREIKMII